MLLVPFFNDFFFVSFRFVIYNLLGKCCVQLAFCCKTQNHYNHRRWKFQQLQRNNWQRKCSSCFARMFCKYRKLLIRLLFAKGKIDDAVKMERVAKFFSFDFNWLHRNEFQDGGKEQTKTMN